MVAGVQLRNFRRRASELKAGQARRERKEKNDWGVPKFYTIIFIYVVFLEGAARPAAKTREMLSNPTAKVGVIYKLKNVRTTGCKSRPRDGSGMLPSVCAARKVQVSRSLGEATLMVRGVAAGAHRVNKYLYSQLTPPHTLKQHTCTQILTQACAHILVIIWSLKRWW